MANMGTEEKLAILFQKFGGDLKLFCSETQTEWGTYHYDFYIWIDSLLKKQLPPNRLEEYEKDGTCVPVLDYNFVYQGKIEEVINTAFEELYEGGRLD